MTYFTEILAGIAGQLSPGPKWNHGKVYAVLAYNFNYRGESNKELFFLNRYYNNPINIVTDPLSGHPLSEVGLNDKVVIISHASSAGFGGFFRGLTPQAQSETIIQRLKQLGLQRAGVIKLHACETGHTNGQFIRSFYHELIRQNILFSYLSAPQGYYVYFPPFRRIVASDAKGEQIIPRPFKGDDKYTILSGNVKRDFPKTRYTLNKAKQFAWISESPPIAQEAATSFADDQRWT
ncbi:hypothetical protein ACGVWS_14380 [Enterobacteriaceae bacterium LUAb1]